MYVVRRCMFCALAFLLAVDVGRLQDITCRPGDSLEKCENVLEIAIALGKEACEYKRDFYSCMKQEGCYHLLDACVDADRQPISCPELCEMEPEFETCTESSSAEDFHLCPHISKDMQTTPAPTAQDFAGAPAIPFTMTAWMAFKYAEGATSSSNVLSPAWPGIVRSAISAFMDLNPLAVNVELPVEFVMHPIGFPDGPAPMPDVEETCFSIFYIHVLDESQVSSTQSQLEAALTGEEPLNISGAELLMSQAINASLPEGAGVELALLKLHVISGRVEEFPTTRTTTVLTTTLSYDPNLVVQFWRAWRVRCAVGIVHRWDIEELELWADRCPWQGGTHRLFPLLPTTSNDTETSTQNGTYHIISSGVLMDECCSEAMAFDGVQTTDFKEGTSWVSKCRSCDAGAAWLGLDGRERKFTVACIVVTQGVAATSQCNRIVLEASQDMSDWEPRGEIEGFGTRQFLCISRTRADYPNLECGVLDDSCRGSINFGECPSYGQVCQPNNRCQCTRRVTKTDPRFSNWECGVGDDGCGGKLDFGSCPIEGGLNLTCVDHVCKSDTFSATQWRIVCESGTVGRWWIREIEFHTEGLCSDAMLVWDSTLTSGSGDRGHTAVKAFDGDVNTFWMSRCFQCKPREAWIGLDFGEQSKVSCVMLTQDSSTLQQCLRIVLEYSDDGEKWWERHRYGFGEYAIRSVEKLQADLDDRKSDKTLRPPERMVRFWRLTCKVKLERHWGVYEIDFYEDTECTRSLRRGLIQISSSRSGSWPASNAFDDRDYTLWKSGCGCDGFVNQGCDPCEPGKAYLGAEFGTLVSVKCVKIQQLGEEAGNCPELHLQFSETGEPSDWLSRDTFEDVGAFAYLKPYQSNLEANVAHGTWSVLSVGVIWAARWIILIRY